MARRVVGGFGIVVWLLSTMAVTSVWAESQKMSFKEDVFPILERRCLACHKPDGEGAKTSGLLLDSYAGVMKGTNNGPVVIPGKTLTSNLLVLVEGKAAIRMPHKERALTKCEVDILHKWIAQGAKDN